MSTKNRFEWTVSLRQNGVGHDKTCADAILPKGHIEANAGRLGIDPLM